MGTVAHDANNQMSVVIGAADFILRRPDIPDAVRVDVEHIRKAAERTSAVTAQLLAFSRRQILQPVVLDLPSLVTRWEAQPWAVVIGDEPGKIDQIAGAT